VLLNPDYAQMLVNIHIEEFISYRSFLTQRLNETGVYLGSGIYLISTQGEGALWTNLCCLAVNHQELICAESSRYY